MENKESSEKKKHQDKSYLKIRSSSFSQNNASDFKFIVPWIQYDKSDLKVCKSSFVNGKD